MMDSIILSLLPVIQAFDTLGIPYYIAGSVAAIQHGYARATNDVDLVADIKPEQATELEQMLTPDYYADANMIRQAALQRTSFNFIDLETFFKIDIFLLKHAPYPIEQMRRRVPIDIDGIALMVASLEDVILAKLDWYRIGGEISDRQWNDIQQLLAAKQDTLDIAYMRHWADEIGVLDLLNRALAEAGV